jgi:PAS domain S-box-containing protein
MQEETSGKQTGAKGPEINAAKKALQESEERFRRLSEVTFEGIGITENGKVVDVNDQLAKMLGYEPDQMIGQDVMNFVAPESRELVLKNIQAGSECPYEHLALRKDGSTLLVEAQSKLLPYQGRLVRVTSIRDITEHRQSGQEIDRRNRELALLNRVIAASAAVVEAKPVLEVVCRELVLAFGLPHVAAVLLDKKKTTATVTAEYFTEPHLSSLDTIIPLTSDPLFQYLRDAKAPLVAHDAQHEPLLAPLHELLRRRGVVSLMIVPLLIGGEIIGGLGLESLGPHHFSTEAINLAWSVADQVAGVLARIRLDEERRRLEEQYHQAQKMEAIGRLTAGIAHDFNNMLTVINGFADLAQSQLQPDDPVQEMMAKIRQSGQRAADLVRQLLVFSRKQLIEPRVLNLNSIVTDMDKMLRRIIGEDIDLRTILMPDLWPVKVDATQIGQVIVNLAVNARDAMPEGGRLIIETANVMIDEGYLPHHFGMQPGRYVLLAVSDTGCGMSKDIQGHVFEPFFTTKPLGKGTGLGLATVYGIVKQSGGDIWLYSEEGIGATFKIYLPSIDEPVPLPDQPEIGPVIPTGNETILLVEDDSGVRELIQQVLRRLGYTLVAAQNGREALRVVAHHAEPIHLLITDVIMPGMTGKVLAEEIHQTRPGLKTLFISGYTDEAMASHSILDPGVAFLQKPFSPTALARKVRAVLDS